MTSAEDCAHDRARAPLMVQDRIFWLLGRASRDAYRITQDRLSAVGLRRGFYGVLASIVEFGPSAQAELGRRLGIDRSDMVAIVNDLESAGYVVRSPDPTDRRRNSVTITRGGRAALKRFDRAIARAEDEFLAGFEPDERRTLLDLIRRLADTGSGRDERSGAATRARGTTGVAKT